MNSEIWEKKKSSRKEDQTQGGKRRTDENIKIEARSWRAPCVLLSLDFPRSQGEPFKGQEI